MKRTYKYRAYANQEALENAGRWLDICRRLYNWGLEQRITAYKEFGVALTGYGQCYGLPDLKKANPEYTTVDAQCLQDILDRVDKTYKAFFRRVKSGEKAGFPRFKGKNQFSSFSLRQHSWWLNGRKLRIAKVGTFKLHLSRPICGRVKTVTMYKDTIGRWYACFSCDEVPEQRLPENDKAIGLDVGIKSFCVDSEGRKTSNPLFFKRGQAQLRRRQRVLSRRVKGSHGRAQARLQVAKAHEKVANQRRDFLHKVANHYISKYGVIAVENLNIKGMVRNHHLARSIQDSSWGEFFRMLSYKAESAGRILIEVPAYNTSQNCSGCGEKVPKTLADRIHACPHCGLVMDRDENAAKNINRAGQARQALTKEVALCVA
jgi:putative transposase